MNNLKPVRPEDLDVKFLMLKQAAREGRLFLDDITVETTDRETVKENVRNYVRRIDSLVTPPFRASIDALWEAIFCCHRIIRAMWNRPGNCCCKGWRLRKSLKSLISNPGRLRDLKLKVKGG